MKPLYFFATTIAVLSLLSMSGCKAQKQMQQQIADLDAKMGDTQRRLTSMDTDLKKATGELNQIKALIAKLGTVVVDLQKAEEDRQKAAAEAKAKASTKGGKKKK